MTPVNVSRQLSLPAWKALRTRRGKECSSLATGGKSSGLALLVDTTSLDHSRACASVAPSSRGAWDGRR
jgi:hypothetical protein